MITKVSDITASDIQNYLRISELTEADTKYLETIKNVAIDFIKNNTGVDDDTIDKYADFIIVVYVLCQDMYDTRSYYVDGNNVNKVVQTILDMHSRNLL
jgi:hypothetical protein